MDILDSVFVLLVAFLGYYVGVKERKGEKIEVNPIKIYKKEIIEPIQEIKSEKEINLEVEKLQTIMSNIDNYKGSSRGQKRVNK